MNNIKTMVIGWDGATFDIIKPLVDKGRLPNIASLMQNGVWCKFESTIPPLTPVAWTSIITGVNPGKHGIYDLLVYEPRMHKFSFVNATLRQKKPVWSILSDRGKTVGVMNVPITYPPDEINGFAISGMLTPNNSNDFIYPKDIKAEIEKRFGAYSIECPQVKDPSAYLNLLLDMIETRESIALHLMDHYPLDFFFLVFVASDRVQHFYWKYLDPSHPEHAKYGNAIAAVYERMDSALGKLIEKVGPDTNVMMVSDHGAGPLNTALYMNNWLIKNNYLHLNAIPSKMLKAKKPAWMKSELPQLVRKAIPRVLLQKFRHKKISAFQDGLSFFCSMIDWGRTLAFSEGVAGGIYINLDIVKREQYNELVDNICNDLHKIIGIDGKKVIEGVYRRDEIYTGDALLKAPDLTVICSKGYQIISPSDILFFDEDFSDTLFLPHRWSARHEMDGIFILKGPNVKKGIELSGCKIVDAAPTMLYAMNELIPLDMDGKVLDKAFEPEYLDKNPARYISEAYQQESTEMNLSEEQEKEIAEKLKDLGYIE